MEAQFDYSDYYCCVPGQSVLGVVRVSTVSNVPAHASRLVRNAGRLKIFFTVAGMDECSYCDVGSGPVGR